MNVKQVIETKQGSVTFSAELTGKELETVITAGLNVMLAHGALPFLSQEEREAATFMVDPSETTQ